MTAGQQLELFTYENAGHYNPRRFWGWAPPKQRIDDVGDEEYLDED